MRIIGYLEHPVLKITVFKMDDRVSVKFESGLYEQTYKFRSGEGVESLEDVKNLVDEPFLQGVLQQLKEMHETRIQGLARLQPGSGTEIFEEII